MRVSDPSRSSPVHPPINTVGMPIRIGALQPDRSPIRAAGRPLMSTVALPFTSGVGGCGPAGGGNEHTWLSPSTAAGIPPIRTSATPGPAITPGWPVGSPTLAAGGTVSPSSVQLDRQTGDVARPGGLHADRRALQFDLQAFDRNLRRLQLQLRCRLDRNRLRRVIQLDGQRAGAVRQLDLERIDRDLLLRARRDRDRLQRVVEFDLVADTR